MEENTMCIQAEAFEMLIRADERTRVIARLLKATPYLGVDEIRAILDIPEADVAKVEVKPDGEF